VCFPSQPAYGSGASSAAPVRVPAAAGSLGICLCG
jgi:hypothetical protein